MKGKAIMPRAGWLRAAALGHPGLIPFWCGMGLSTSAELM
jgi:hypothetical protein